jgi:hypothetical protein
MNRLAKMGYQAPDYARVFMCALDFIRAMNERPWLVKILCRLFFGKWAYSEFCLMVRALDEQRYDPFYSYGLEEAAYHRPERLTWWSANENDKGAL